MEGHAGVARRDTGRAIGRRIVSGIAAVELRRRWPGWLMIGLGIAVGSAIVLGSVAGARRTVTVDERARLDNRAGTTAVEVKRLSEADIDRIRAMPEIEGSARNRKYIGEIDGWDGYQFYIDAGDAALGRDVDRLVYVDGRPPRSADELVIDATTAETIGLGVGDRLSARIWDPATIDLRARTATSSIPLDLEIVGVANSPGELSRLPGSLNGWSSPAFDEAHRRFANFDAVSVRLRGGQESMKDFNRSLNDLSKRVPALAGEELGAVTDSGDSESRVGAALDALGLALLAIAGAVAVTGTAALGTALLRRFVRRADDLRSLPRDGCDST